MTEYESNDLEAENWDEEEQADEANSKKEAIYFFYNKFNDTERKRYRLLDQPKIIEGE